MWEYPELIYEILKNSEINIVKDNLAPFFINNFYTDYLSGNFVENNLLYVIALLVKNELEKYENLENMEHFLENSNLGIVLNTLGQIPEVQNFFKLLILKSLEKLERYNSMEEIQVDVDEISSKLTEAENGKKEDEKNKFTYVYKKVINEKMRYQNVINMKRRNDNYQIFFEKYLIDIKISEITEKKEEAKKENKEELYIILSKIEEEFKSKNNEDLFSNKILMENFVKSTFSYTLSSYQNEFLKGIDFINQLITDFENNVFLMPKFIKSICKIISILIKNKFNNSSKIDENFFISKFIINQLLLYFLSSPNFNALIHHFVISESTIRNIKEISVVLKKLFSGKLFKNSLEEYDYTPYNRYILEKYENVINILENLKKIKLPNFIEDLIENKLPNEYLYDYFEENSEKIFVNISICFTLDNLWAIINGIQKTENFFEKDKNDKKIKIKKSFDKLIYKEYNEQIKNVNEETIKNYLKEIKEKDKVKKKKNDIIDSNYNIENYYLLNIQIIEKKYEKIFNINNNKYKYFFIDAKDKNQKQLNENEINLINLKNNLSEILGIFRPLDVSDFSFNESPNFIQILSEIKKYINYPNYTLTNENLKNISNWSISSIFDYINKIPNEYKLEDYKKLFTELESNILKPQLKN